MRLVSVCGLLSVVLSALGCAAPGKTCTPGAQVSCACIGGAAGAQVCNSDGESLGTCLCGAPQSDGGGSMHGSADAGVQCHQTFLTAANEAVDLYVMLSQASSMAGSLGAQQSKWSVVTSGLGDFASHATAGSGLGLQYFGLPASCPTACTFDGDCGTYGPCSGTVCLGCFGNSCVASDYATPSVEIAPLQGNAGTVNASLAAHSPWARHATAPALQGLVDHAKAQQSLNPARRVEAVLITDGEPNACDSSTSGLTAIASTAFAGRPSISTTVLTLGPVASGNGIADAGGTGSARAVTSASDLSLALQSLVGEASRCRFVSALGATDGGVMQVQQGSQTFVRVTSLAACGQDGGWYATGPDGFALCPSSCGLSDAGVFAISPCAPP